ncbi:MAG: hypothetical protein DBX52_03965 [Clostridiales bacterium]|nr:MAG: hypothetical protein DBX52_03965 [Clostridiales bacterium]
MAKKSTRLLSILLAILMVVSMTSVMATAQYEFNPDTQSNNYYSISYDTLVGGNNQTSRGVYVVNEAWVFEEGKEPATVSFYFRGETVTETYNPARHLASVAAVYIQAAADGIKQPTCILTAGTYSKPISLTNNITLLGANAGINPNIPDPDPTVEWELNPERYLPELGDADSKNETRFWLPGEEDFNASYGGGNSSMNTKLITIEATKSGAKNYIIDGLVLQGYGAVIADTSASGGAHNVYVQNCVMNNGYSYDCEMLRFWNRGAGNTCEKKLYFSNCYITGQKNLCLYSGHASAIRMKGFSYQNCPAGAFYNANTLQWQGFSFELVDSHFWNEDGFEMRSNGYGQMFMLQHTANSQAMAGTNNEPFRYNISNNTFYNADSMSKKANGTYEKNVAFLEISMAGTNEDVIIADNTFINTYPVAAGTAENPIVIRYLTDANGIITHAGTADPKKNADGDYALNSNNLHITGNTFVGAFYQNVPSIGVNNHPDTLVEMEGNLYLDSVDATAGNMIAGTDKVYDKWVWMDTQLTEKSSTLFVNEFQVLTAGISVSNQDMTMNLEPTVYSQELSFNCNDKNSVAIYQSNENFEKGALIEGYTIDTSARTSYYVVSLQSYDKRTTQDYYLTVNRAVNTSSELYGITPTEEMMVEKAETTADVYNYEVNFDNTQFEMTASASEGATVTLKNAKTGAVITETDGKFIIPLSTIASEYHYYMDVSDADGITERYDLFVTRKMSTHAEVLNVTSGEDCAVIEDAANKTWRIEGTATSTNISFGLDISEYASVVLRDTVYGSEITPVRDQYTLERVSAGETRYNATVTAQDGVSVENWTLIVYRPENDACELLGVDNATLENGAYVARISSPMFFVNVTGSASSTYRVYADENGTQLIENPYLILQAATTDVWVQVIAEDGQHKSELVKVTIYTTADLNAAEDGPVYKPMLDNGIIGVTGAEPFTADDTVVAVNLDENTNQYFFKALGLGGYEIHVYTDMKMTLETAAEQVLTLDSGITRLYIRATKGDDERVYTIEISSPRFYEYSDTLTPWAKEYIEGLKDTGLGLMKGDENGAFNGEDCLSRYEMATLLVRLEGANKELFKNVRSPFQDTLAEWAADYVKAAYRLGLVGGYDVTDENGNVTGYLYNGDNVATRSEFIRVYMNVYCYMNFGVDVDTYYANNKEAIDEAFNAKGFKDAGEVGAWAVPGVYTAVAEGLIAGDENQKINPEGNITRNEVATVLFRYLV